MRVHVSWQHSKDVVICKDPTCWPNYKVTDNFKELTHKKKVPEQYFDKVSTLKTFRKIEKV